MYFRYDSTDAMPLAELNIHSDSDDDRLGGVALNCLHVPDVSAVSGMFGKRFSFDESVEEMGVELGESVFWRPGGDTLEVKSVHIEFGEPRDELLPIAIDARCCDIETGADIAVSIRGTARLG